MTCGQRPSERWLRSLPREDKLAFELEWLSQGLSAKARALLDAAGISQSEAARKAGIPRWRVGELVRRGETTPRTWVAFCSVFGIDAEIRVVALQKRPADEEREAKRGAAKPGGRRRRR